MKRIIQAILNMNGIERKLIKTFGTVVLNGIMGVYKLFLGIYYMSDWLTVNALYYLVLSVTKGQILKKYAVVEQCRDSNIRHSQENEIFLKTGRFESLIGISYFCVSLHTLFAGDVVFYPEYIRYVMVIIAIGKMSFGIYGLYKTRKLRNPVIAAIHIVDFTDAVVSIVACRSVLQVMKQVEFATQSSGIVGILCSIMFVVIGNTMKNKISDRKEG